MGLQVSPRKKSESESGGECDIEMATREDASEKSFRRQKSNAEKSFGFLNVDAVRSALIDSYPSDALEIKSQRLSFTTPFWSVLMVPSRSQYWKA